MTDSSTNTKHQVTGLEDTTFNILVALGKEAQFLYSTIDNYIADAKKGARIRPRKYVGINKAR